MPLARDLIERSTRCGHGVPSDPHMAFDKAVLMEGGLPLAAMGAALADRIDRGVYGRPADGSPLGACVLELNVLWQAWIPVERGRQSVHLARLMELTLRLVRGRSGSEVTNALFFLRPRLGDSPTPFKGRAGMCGFSGLLGCLFLREAGTLALGLPLAEDFEGTRLARMMCAALWLASGHGYACREQLDRVGPEGPGVGVLDPRWLDELLAELRDDSAGQPG